jgi:hypothetical protein
MELNKAPSYQQLALAILNNDRQLKSLGRTPRVSPYYHALKKIELTAAGRMPVDRQLRFDFT